VYNSALLPVAWPSWTATPGRKEGDVQVRAFDGSLEDARAIMDIDRATFADCPYNAEQIVALEADPNHYAWVGERRERVVGYVSAFVTFSQAAGRWEIDELAVHPQAQRQGIGTALVARALEVGAQQEGLREARALVAVGNAASQQVFLKNGFQAAGTMHLLAYRANGRVPRLMRPGAPVVRRAVVGDIDVLVRLFGSAEADGSNRRARMVRQLCRRDVEYLVAVDAIAQDDSQTVSGSATQAGVAALGVAELLHVRTLQYEGLWVESLSVTGERETERQWASALLCAAIEKVKRQAELDLVGYLVAPREKALYSAAVSEGMTLVDVYKTFVYEW
jgi:ribosomal protein S18 acetylase RimI-like enzyme